jgi:3-oxoacyl-(acyl-carrier-protein) synthase
MSGQVFITGLGHISGLGAGRNALLEAIEGKRLPERKQISVRTSHGVRETSLFTAPEVTLPATIPESIKRRMARVAKMAFFSANEAMQDAFVNSANLVEPDRVGIVVGTAYGCLELASAYQRRIVEQGPPGASPSIFSGSVQNAIASQLSISLGIQGPTATVTTIDQTTIGSLRVAFDWLKFGEVDHVLVAIGDEHSELHTYLAADSGSTETLGEGIASFVLSREDAKGIKQRYCELFDVQAFAGKKPLSVSQFEGAEVFGSAPWARSFAPLFGSMATCSAFEISMAALMTSSDLRTRSCFQTSRFGENQTVGLRSALAEIS